MTIDELLAKEAELTVSKTESGRHIISIEWVHFLAQRPPEEIQALRATKTGDAARVFDNLLRANGIALTR